MSFPSLNRGDPAHNTREEEVQLINLASLVQADSQETKAMKKSCQAIIAVAHNQPKPDQSNKPENNRTHLECSHTEV